MTTLPTFYIVLPMENTGRERFQVERVKGRGWQVVDTKRGVRMSLPIRDKDRALRQAESYNARVR